MKHHVYPYRRMAPRRLRPLVGLLFLLAACHGWAQPGPAPAPDSTGSGEVILRDNFFPVEHVPGLVDNESAMRAGLLFDCVSRKIVWEKDMHYAYPIASLTKMMVALLLVEDVLECRADWSDEVVMHRRLVKRVRRKRVVYNASETYTLDGLLHLAMIPSHNEACNTIARHLAGGNVDDFVDRMNRRARALHMNNTFYSNPSGLPAGRGRIDNNASPADLLLLALECLKHPEIINVARIGYAEVANDKTKAIYRNHNHLVIDYENEVDGLKTGYTRNARYCLTATACKDNHRLISIVLGCRNTWERNRIVADMLSSYYEQIGIGRLGKTWEETLAMRRGGKDSASAAATLDGSTLPVYNYKTVWTTEKSLHRIRPGETLSTIAQRYKCSVRSLRKWNHLRSSRIYAGHKLVLYKNVRKKVAIKEDEIEPGDSNEEPADSGTATASRESVQDGNFQQNAAASAKADYIYHTVQPGDTLWNIARQYDGVTVEQLKRLNNIGNSKYLRIGTRLKIHVDT